MENSNTVNFSSANIEKLSELTDSLGDCLIHSHFGGYVDQLSQMRLSALSKNETDFKVNVLDRSLFGAMGSLGDIWIEDAKKRREFKKRFTNLIDHLIIMGLDHPRIAQVRKYLQLD